MQTYMDQASDKPGMNLTMSLILLIAMTFQLKVRQHQHRMLHRKVKIQQVELPVNLPLQDGFQKEYKVAVLARLILVTEVLHHVVQVVRMLARIMI